MLKPSGELLADAGDYKARRIAPAPAHPASRL